MTNIFEEAANLEHREYVILRFESCPPGIQMHALRLEERESLWTLFLPISDARRLAEWLADPSSRTLYLEGATLSLSAADSDLVFEFDERIYRGRPSSWVHLFEDGNMIEALLNLLQQ